MVASTLPAAGRPGGGACADQACQACHTCHTCHERCLDLMDPSRRPPHPHTEERQSRRASARCAVVETPCSRSCIRGYLIYDYLSIVKNTQKRTKDCTQRACVRVETLARPHEAARGAVG